MLSWANRGGGGVGDPPIAFLYIIVIKNSICTDYYMFIYATFVTS